MPPPEERGQAKPEEFLKLHKQINDLLTQMRLHVESDWAHAQDAIATLVRMQTAQALATQFLERKSPYKKDPQLWKLVQDGLLNHQAFLQKPPLMLRFYRRLLFAMEEEPSSILEIGVKGGGSTAFWKALFPDAHVVGLDIKLRRWLVPEPSVDGVVYLQGDQTDLTRLEEIAATHGPFSVVIDDGSHVTDHQAATIRCLLPHVKSGGFYVVEDIHTSVKKPAAGRSLEYGADIWADFTMAVFQHLRKGPAPPATAGAQLAAGLVPMIDDLIVSSQVLAIRTGARATGD